MKNVASFTQTKFLFLIEKNLFNALFAGFGKVELPSSVHMSILSVLELSQDCPFSIIRL